MLLNAWMRLFHIISNTMTISDMLIWNAGLLTVNPNMRSTEKIYTEVPDFKSWASMGRAFQVKLKLLGG